LTPIAFGTDGWRAVIAREFTFENLERVSRALAHVWLQDRADDASDSPVIVGHDTRFLSREFAASVAEIMAAAGFEVLLVDRPCSSPAVSWAVKEKGARGAVMITASHNPPEYNGFKIKAHYGGSASPELTRRVETAIDLEWPPGERSPGSIHRFDPEAGYFAQLGRLVDLPRIARAGIQVIHDPMYGAGAGYLRQLLGPHGIQLTEIHGDRNPGFGGVNPEPIATNLNELAVRTREAGSRTPLVVGLAVDGDADRIGAVDASGQFVNSHQILSLMLDHLASVKGWTGGVIRTFSTSRLVAKLAEQHGLPLHETPIGFKYVCDLMVREDILIGGEESGGIGIKGHLPERDGILCSLMLLEIMATHGANLLDLVARLEATHGAHRYDRIDLHLTEAAVKDRVMERLKTSPPGAIAGQTVTGVETLDGIKFSFDHGGWLLVRASGTEPLLRVYAEAPAAEQVRALLAAGKAWTEDGW
jgi:phosphomannomutase